MAANKIVLQVDFQTGGAQAAIDDINKKIAAMGPTTAKASAEATAGLKRVTVSVDSTVDSLAKLSRAMAGLGIAKVTNELLHMGAALNDMQRDMEGLAGGTEGIRAIGEAVKATGMFFPGAAEGFRKLVNAGMPAGQAVQLLKDIDNWLAKAGRTSKDIGPIASMFAQIQAGKPINQKTLSQIFNLSDFPAQLQIMDRLKLSVQEFRNETKLFSGPGMVDAIGEIMNQMARGEAASESLRSLERQENKNTFALGQFSQIMDKAVDPSLIKFYQLISKLLDVLGKFLDLFTALPEPVKDVAVAIGIVTGAVLGLATALGVLQLSWIPVKGIWATIMGTAGATAVAGAAGAAAGAGVGVGVSATTGILAGAAGGAITGTEVGTGLAPGVGTLVGLIVGAIGGTLLAMNWDAGKPKPADVYAGQEQPAASDATIAAKLRAAQMVDEEKQKQQIEHARDILDQAQVRLLKAGKDGIAALVAGYDEYFRHAAGNETALAILRKALATDVQSEVIKRGEEANRESQKNLVDYRRAQRQSAIAAVEAVVDETIASREQVAEVQRRAREQELREDEIARDVQRKKQLEKDLAAYKLSADQVKALRAATMLEIQTDELHVTEQIEHYRLEQAKATNAAVLADRKKAIQDELDDVTMRVNAMRDLRVQHAQLVEPRTLEERLDQINTVHDIEIKNIEDVNRARMVALDANKRALDDLLNKEQYKDLDLISRGLAPRTDSLTQSQIDDRRREIEKNFQRDKANIAYEAEVQFQQARYALWKQTNEAILQEQRRVFSDFKDAAGQVFDAIFDRSKSFFASIGDLLKKAVIGTAKEFVTNRVAAGLSDLFGYGKPTLRGRFPLGEDVLFGGAGAPPGAPRSSEEVAIRFDIVAVNLNNAANNLTLAAYALQRSAMGGVGGGGGGSRYGEAAREMEQGMPDYVDPGDFPLTQLPSIFGGAATPPFIPPTGPGGSLAKLGGLFGIGGGTTSLRSVLTSKGVGSLAAMLGYGLYSGGLAGRSPLRTISGAAITGAGLAQAFGRSPIGGAILGAGVGLYSAGMQRGGLSGLAMTTGGGLVAGAEIGAMFGPTGLAVGAAIGAGAGLITGIVGLFRTSPDQQVRELIRKTYGVDIREKSVRDQIVGIAQQNYGGNIRLAVFSPEVQELVRLYAQAYGIGTNTLPRPMYGATFQQSTAGGLQLQPVYSGGQVVANPYSGTTTAQFNAAASQPVFMQLDPQKAMQLFSGQVVQVLGNNPGAVANANTTAAVQGSSRTTQSAALLEPLTVTR